MPGAKGRKKEPVDPVILQLAKVAILTAAGGLDEAEADVIRHQKIRDEAIKRAKGLGIRGSEIAPLLGVTAQRVSQISPDSLPNEDESQGEQEEQEEQETDTGLNGDDSAPPT